MAVKSLVSSAERVTHAEIEMIDHSSESLRVKVERLDVVVNDSEKEGAKRRQEHAAVNKRARHGEGGGKVPGNADCIVIDENDDDDDEMSSFRRPVCDRHPKSLSVRSHRDPLDTTVVDLCDSDEPEEIDKVPRAISKTKAVVDLCDDSVSMQPGAIRSTEGLRRPGVKRGCEWEEEDEDYGYESKDILAAERRTLEDWTRKQFEASGCKVQRIWHNPKSFPGENLYEAFAAGYKLARSTKSIELKFHGTPECYVDSICENGLDPGKRNGQAYGEGEYFGGVPRDSVGYCRGGSKMLIFAVLMDDSGLTFKGAGGQHSEVRVAPLA